MKNEEISSALYRYRDLGENIERYSEKLSILNKVYSLKDCETKMNEARKERDKAIIYSIVVPVGVAIFGGLLCLLFELARDILFLGVIFGLFGIFLKICIIPFVLFLFITLFISANKNNSVKEVQYWAQSIRLYAAENNIKEIDFNKLNQAINNINQMLQPLESEMFSIKCDLEREAHTSIYFERYSDAAYIANKMYSYNISFERAYKEYEHNREEHYEYMERREKEQKIRNEINSKLDSINDSIERGNREAQERFEEAKFRETMRDILRR